MPVQDIKTAVKRRMPYLIPLYRRLPGKRRPPMSQIFKEIRDTNMWGGAESVSGPGSDLGRTDVVRRELPGLVRQLGVSTLLDAPCGDFHWMRLIMPELRLDRYVGVDIVPELIEDDRRRYGDERCCFELADLTTGPLPRADLVLCRDLLVHLAYKDARATLRALKATGAEHLLCTSFLGVERNHDIEAGEWRPLNMERAPFRFPPPQRTIAEGWNVLTPDEPYEPVWATRVLGLWRFDELPLG
jgi:hypothetical protein